MTFATRFTDHPATVGESYGEHMRVALGFSRQLAGASAKALVHAFLPWLCTTSASRKVAELHDEMTSGARGERAEREAAQSAMKAERVGRAAAA